MRLNLPRRTKRRVPQRERQPLWVEPRMNAVWAIDFMRDTLYCGRVFRTLNVLDEANRGALGIDVAVSIPATRVSTFLMQMIDLHGRPSAIRCDNGPELTSQTFIDWCREQDIELRFIQPGCSRNRGKSNHRSGLLTKPGEVQSMVRLIRYVAKEIGACISWPWETAPCENGKK